jgi:hypothetical protein
MEGSSKIRTPRQHLSDGETENDTVESEKASNGQERTTSRERRQRRPAHRSHEQIQFLRTIARMEEALQEGQQVTLITRAQDLVLEDMDMAWSSHVRLLKVFKL